MREHLNNNPVVQAAVIGVLLIVAVVFMIPMFSHKSSSSTSATTAAPPAPGVPPATGAAPVTGAGTGAVAPSAGAVAPGTGAVPPTATPPVAPSAGSTGSVPPEALVPGPGLPQRVIVSWAHGDAIALLVVRNGAVDDELVHQSVRRLHGMAHLAIFVVHSQDIARYSRITQGVGVDRAPALVVVRPRSLSGTTPQAQVHYGFRDAQGVVQAVRDAFYRGKDNLPYSPR